MALDALYIDPDLSGRLRFKQLGRGPGMFHQVFTTNTLIEALERLEGSRCYDVVYIASRFSTEVVRSFIAAARRADRVRKAVFMVVLAHNECDMTTLAEFALAGADGFLVAPFSANSLAENIAIAVKIVTARTRRNQEVSLELLIKATVGNFSTYAKRTREKGTVSAARTQLRRTHELALALPEDLQLRFRALLIERLASFAQPRRTQNGSRRGFMPSRRQSVVG